MLPMDAVGSPAVPVQRPGLHVPSSLLQDETKTAGFVLQHLPLFHASAQCWISLSLISCFIALPPWTLSVRDVKMRGFIAECNPGGTSDETLLGLLVVRKNSRMEVRPRRHMYTTEFMESMKQTSRGLLYNLQRNCLPAGMATPALGAWVKEDDTSMWQRYHGASVYSH